MNANEVVFQGIVSFITDKSNGKWTGTMTELTTRLNKTLNKQERSFLPGSPSALRVVINRVINRIRNQGVGVKFSRAPNRMRTRFVKFVA